MPGGHRVGQMQLAGRVNEIFVLAEGHSGGLGVPLGWKLGGTATQAACPLPRHLNFHQGGFAFSPGCL